MVSFGDVGDAFKNAGNAGLDKLGDVVDSGKEKLGEGVNWATDKAGGALDAVGAEGVADDVEGWGDKAASELGAKVGEQQLGQTDDPKLLVHGSAAEIRASALHLGDFYKAFDRVGDGMRRLDSSRWRGEAAEAFRRTFEMHPTKWLHAADACGKAATALERYAETVEWAQQQAADAIALYKRGQETSQQAVAAYNKRVDTYNAAVQADQDPGPRPEPFSDPGEADLKQAADLLAEARRQRDDMGRVAADEVKAALEHAPTEPAPLDKLAANTVDLAQSAGTELTHVAGGVIKGGAGLVNFGRGLLPMDPYNLTHPVAYMQNASMTLSGLVSSVAQPQRTAKNALDAFNSDRSEFIGRLLPELASTKGAGFGRAGFRTAGKNGLEGAAETGAKPSARDGVSRNPAEPSRQPEAVESRHTDPIDLATGKMYLPQTDVTLPGVLPLIFKRRVESGYHLGHWFGPSWSSTVDQRLEVDSEGIIFIHDDGLLLAYPHPAPGVPVLPSHGPRWPLDRASDGAGYTITDPVAGRVWHFTDRNEHLSVLEQIDDRNGNWITFSYDAEGAPTEIAHCAGYRVRVTTDGERVTALHLAGAGMGGTDQELIRYGYTEGNLTEVTGSSGLPLRFAYDDAGRVTSWTDTNERSYTYEYDAQDRCIAEGGTEGHMALRLDYDSSDPATGLRVTRAVTGGGHERRYVINDIHQVVAEIDPLGAVNRYERDRHNRLLCHTDPLGHTTTFRYDEAGNLTTVIRPDGRETRAEYNELGLPVKVVNPDGTVWRQEYDARGNRTATTASLGRTTHFAYDEAGRLTAVTNALGVMSTVRCDAAGLPVEITGPQGVATRYRRDAFGRPVAVTDALGATTLLEWTVEGKLARRTAPDGSTESWVYDGEGNCTAHTDAMGVTTSYEYTHFDLLKARTEPNGVRYEFDYDSELHLTQVTNPQGLTWRYDYDPAGRLIAETDFDDRALAYTYDSANRLTSRTNGLGERITYERNALGQLASKNVEGRVTTFEYDLTDQLAQATGPNVSLTLLRDSLGRLKYETVNGRRISFSYDALGRRTSRTTPTGATSSWTYDAMGNRAALVASGRTIAFEHDAVGRELTRRIGDTAPVSFTNTFDPLGRLAAQSVTGADGGSIQRRAYQYRSDGKLIGIDDQLNGARHFGLDTAGRITAVHAVGWTESYAYDTAGNQTSASWPDTHPGHEASGLRTYNGTRIKTAGGIRYEHDAQGRVVLRQKTRLSRKPDTWRYAWDAEDRLTSVVTPDGTTWRYLYDPLGRRTAKQRLASDGSGEVVEQVDFTWDGSTLCEQTSRTSVASPSAVILTWDHQGQRPIAQTERILAGEEPQQEIDSRFFAIITDLVGAPTELLNEQGDITWRTRSTVWGTTAWNHRSATAYTPLRFPGQYFDAETGLHYNYFRTYDPETARYLTSDALGLAPAPNPNTYVQNPHTQADPLGLAPDYSEEKRGPFDFREPNPAHPPNSSVLDAMRQAPVGGNIDCSEIAEYIMRRSDGDGKIINFTTHSGEDVRIPSEGGRVVTDYRYHDVYTDGRYVYDPEMSQNPIPLGDYKRALRHLNQGEKVVIGDGGYDGPLF
ncbi:putative T7SS-secreted protein [Streptomyces monticola]|uniref:T7SS-secreted protein n=1 Tax=Streptomyces monticola TaxID=2666263 RepID=A0ABW2JB03_9ACTN